MTFRGAPSCKPQKSFIRQREIERDTPSMRQALLDSLQEDPDVLVVGEMREPETMRLTVHRTTRKPSRRRISRRPHSQETWRMAQKTGCR